MNLAIHLSREISSVSKKIKKQCFLRVLFSCWSPSDCWQWGLPISFSQKLCAHVRILSSSVPAKVLIVLSLSKRTAKPTFSEATLALEWSNILPFTHYVVLGKSHQLHEPDSSPARWGWSSLPHRGVVWTKWVLIVSAEKSNSITVVLSPRTEG